MTVGPMIAGLALSGVAACDRPSSRPRVAAHRAPVATTRRPLPPRIHYVSHNDQITRVTKRPGQPALRKTLGTGLLAPAEPNGLSYAAAIQTAELCTRPWGSDPCRGRGPCEKRGRECVSGARWVIHGPTGRIVHRDRSINFLPDIHTLLGRYVIWTVLVSPADGAYRSLIFDPIRRRKFTTEPGTKPRLKPNKVCYRLAFLDYPPEERNKEIHRPNRCFHVKTWTEHSVSSPNPD